MPAFLATTFVAISLSNVYDVVMPLYRPSCSNGCLPWAEAARSLNSTTQAVIDGFFVKGARGSAAAGSACAMPGAQAGTHEKDCGLHCHPGKDQWSYIYDSYAGPWCFCKDPIPGIENTSQYCTPALDNPEQINLQYASPTAVVVGFVTYELQGTGNGSERGGGTLDVTGDVEATLLTPPTAVLLEVPPSTMMPSSVPQKEPPAQTIAGVSHLYAPPGRNVSSAVGNATEFALPYMMHYITLPVVPGKRYSYKVLCARLLCIARRVLHVACCMLRVARCALRVCVYSPYMFMYLHYVCFVCVFGRLNRVLSMATGAPCTPSGHLAGLGLVLTTVKPHLL